MKKILLPLLAAAMLAGPAAAQTLDRIKETNTFRIGFRTDAAPLSFADAENKPSGYAPMVCSEIAQGVADHLQSEELDVYFVPVDSKTRFQMVADGEIDLLCGAATITLGRRALVDFSDPIYVDGISLMLPKEADPSMEALAGKKVGVRAGTTTEETVRNSFQRAEVDAELVSFDNHRAGMAAMETGEIDAYFADQSILFNLYFGSDAKEKFKVSTEVLSIEKQGLAMARGDADFRLLVDTVLSKLFFSGKMDKLFQASFPGATPGMGLNAMYLVGPTIP